jgi:hypothetical protein
MDDQENVQKAPLTSSGVWQHFKPYGIFLLMFAVIIALFKFYDFYQGMPTGTYDRIAKIIMGAFIFGLVGLYWIRLHLLNWRQDKNDNKT